MVTLAEYARDPRKHIELVNGTVVESPRVSAGHFRAGRVLADVLERHGLIAGMCANLILDDRDPLRPLVREPDVYVTRTQPERRFQHVENILLVAEIVSPGSGITDWIEKMSEYADAGIAQYWIVDIFYDGSVHLYTFRLKPGGYGEREHWDKEVDIDVAGVRVQFDVRDLVRREM